MKYLKMLGLAAVAAMALTAFLGAGSASAAGLYKYTTPSANDAIALNTELVSSLETGSSALLKDTLGGANDTCTSSEVKGKIEKNTTTAPVGTLNPQGRISALTFGGCSHTTTVISTSEEAGVKYYGELEIKHIAGTTNGTVVSKNSRVTVKSTIFGVSCIANTGAGTAIGTLTGAKSPTANATMDINGTITLENGCGDSTWTGSYEVTSPVGLTVEAS